MIILKKLHIKILSLAFLVTLVSYNTLEARILPQQFVSEYVVFEQTEDRCASYSIYEDPKYTSNSRFTNFSFQDLLLTFNTIQNIGFVKANHDSDSLKDLRKIKSFSPRIILFKDLHTLAV